MKKYDNGYQSHFRMLTEGYAVCIVESQRFVMNFSANDFIVDVFCNDWSVMY